MGAGKLPRPGIFIPVGGGREAAQGEGKITRGIFTPGGASCPEAPSPPGASCSGCKINRYTGIVVFFYICRDRRCVTFHPRICLYLSRTPVLVFSYKLLFC